MFKWLRKNKLEILESPNQERTPDETNQATSAGLMDMLKHMPKKATIALCLNQEAEFRLRIQGQIVFDREMNEVLLFPIVEPQEDKKEKKDEIVEDED